MPDASTAASAAEVHSAGLVLVDVSIPGGFVLAVRQIRDRSPGAAVVVAAHDLDQEQLLATIRAGADGYVYETLGVRGWVRAVEVALAGDTVIPRAGVGALIEQLRGGAQEQIEVDGLPLQLTRREAHVLTRLRDGMTPKQIAYELALSDVTVRRHLSSVAKKRRQARPLTLTLESTS